MFFVIIIIVIVVVIVICVKKKQEKNVESKPTVPIIPDGKQQQEMKEKNPINDFWSKNGNCSIKELEREVYYKENSSLRLKYVVNLFFASEEDGGFGIDKKYIKHFFLKKRGSTPSTFYKDYLFLFSGLYGKYSKDWFDGNFIFEYIRNMAKAGLLDYLFDYKLGSECPLWCIHKFYEYWEKENEDNISKFKKKLIFDSKSLLYDKRVYDVDSVLARTERLNIVSNMIMKDIPCIYLLDKDGEKTDKCFSTDDLLSMDHYQMLEIMSKSKS